MLTGLAAVVEDIGIGAASVFEGVGEDGEAVEGAVSVDGIGEALDGRRFPSQVEGDRSEGVADDVTEQGRLHSPFPVAIYARTGNCIGHRVCCCALISSLEHQRRHRVGEVFVDIAIANALAIGGSSKSH